MQNKPVATTSQAGRVVASNALANRQRIAREGGYNHDTPPISADQAAADPAPIFPETLGKAPLATIPEPPAFTRAAARRPVDRPREPLLQWATGLPTKDRKVYAGWFVEAGQSEALDDAMGLAGFAPVAIKHGAGNVVTHWALPACSLFVIADGIQTMSEMRDSPDRYGIAFGWRDNDGRPQSVLRARVLIQELCAVGYTQPLLLSVKSTLTGDLLNALIRHYSILDSINPIRKAAGKSPINVPFYAVSIRLGAGDEVQRGSGQTKEITPMIEVGERDREYVLAHWCKREWVQAIESIADSTVIWSRAQSLRIAAGESTEGEE